MRPIIKERSAEKVFRYFFGNKWEKYEIVELAIRNGANKINIFDDELYVWNSKTKTFKTFNWNADPSAYRIGKESIAILRTGVHFYTISYHHIGENAKRYVALRPNTPGNAVPVWRMDANGKLYLSTGYAVNQHAGGDRTTGSRGCQTAPRAQFPEFIQFVGSAFGLKIPLGVQRKSEKRFLDGIGNIPYILITQEQFDYIQDLPESEFDSPADLKYQLQNFVNVPKVEHVQPVIVTNPDAKQTIDELEAEELDPSAQREDTENSAVVPPVEPVNNEPPPAAADESQTVIPQTPSTEQPSNDFLNTCLEKARVVSDSVSKVSKSSWAVTILKGAGAWLLMMVGVVKENWEIILVAAVIILAVIWFIKSSKDRATERTIVQLEK